MATKSQRYITDEKGHRTAIVLDIGDYDELLEDIESLALIADAKGEKEISVADVKKKMKKRGIV